jgi:menaquinone-9 beta-reductase
VSLEFLASAEAEDGRERRDVIVVGGGPAGSAAAILLRRRGHDVLLVDQARFPRDKVCGEAVSPGAWPILDELGARCRVTALHPQPLRGMVLTSPDGTLFRGTYRTAAEPGFAVRRDALDQALLQTARDAGVEVREGVRATGPVGAGGRVCGVAVESDSGGKTLRARMVVGADGRRSVVARRLGLLSEHRSLRRFAVRGHWEGVCGLSEFGEMHVGGGGYCGVAPLSSTRANVAFVVDQREMGAAGGDLEGFYRSTLRRWPRIVERLKHAVLAIPPRAVGPLALVARRLTVPGALLVGDAAGFYDPFTGEGVTLALRSASLAAEVIDRALQSSVPGDLGEYERRRHAATEDKFRLNRLFHQVVGWPALSNAVARRLARRPDLADRLVGIAGDFVPARTAFDLRFLYALLTA